MADRPRVNLEDFKNELLENFLKDVQPSVEKALADAVIWGSSVLILEYTDGKLIAEVFPK